MRVGVVGESLRAGAGVPVGLTVAAVMVREGKELTDWVVTEGKVDFVMVCGSEEVETSAFQEHKSQARHIITMLAST